MATTTEKTVAEESALYPLASGDRLSRAEFERRYAAMPELKKAELIQGVVYVGSPVRMDHHARPHSLLAAWAVNYVAATPGLETGDNATVRLDDDSEPQPDVLIRVLPDCGGATTIEDGYVVGPPELIAEVAASSATYDLHDKLAAYRDAGVPEYLVWRVLDKQFDWFVLQDGKYVLQTPSPEGLLESVQFPGLRLHRPSLLAENAAAVFEHLQAGLKTDRHQEWVQALATKHTQ